MSGLPAPWVVVSLGDDALILRMVERLDVRSFAERLLVSKAESRRVIAHGQLVRAGKALGPQDVLQMGDTVILRFRNDSGDLSRDDSSTCQMTQPPLDLVYQDQIMLAVDKPAGLLVHGDGTGADTLAARVQTELASRGRKVSLQPVQRLDVETTGIVLFSLVPEFQPALDAQVSGHDMLKRYLAVVDGHLAGSADEWLELDAPIARDRHDARRMRVGRTGKPSLTRVRTIGYQGGYSLLLVELGSGRKHQIRVHLAHERHPIVGDALYGGKRYRDGLMLHAWGERLVHPVSGEALELHTSWPARFSVLFPERTWDEI